MHCQTVNAIQTSCKNVNFYFNISILMNFIKKLIKKYYTILKKKQQQKTNNKSSSILYCISCSIYNGNGYGPTNYPTGCFQINRNEYSLSKCPVFDLNKHQAESEINERGVSQDHVWHQTRFCWCLHEQHSVPWLR